MFIVKHSGTVASAIQAGRVINIVANLFKYLVK